MTNSFWQRSIFILQIFTIISTVFCNDDLQSLKEIELKPKIIGGHEIEISQHPYIVSVLRKSCEKCAYEHRCGGTIFNEEFIITAADCVSDAEPREIHIVAGSSLRTYSLQDGGKIFPVSKITVHPNSNIDLALLRLELKIPLHNSLTIAAVTLAKTIPEAGTNAVIAGWGQIAENGAYSEHLREAVVPIVDQEKCMKAFERSDIKDYEICAGFQNGGVDACNGDAGGPLLVDDQLVGVTSRGYGCARPGSPGVYTNVVHLNEWIVSQVLGVHTAFL